MTPPPHLTAYFWTGVPPRPRGNDLEYAGVSAYETKDGILMLGSFREGQHRRLDLALPLPLKVVDLLAEVSADCPRRTAGRMDDQCGVRCPGCYRQEAAPIEGCVSVWPRLATVPSTSHFETRVYLMNLYIGTIFESLFEAFVNVRAALRPSNFLVLHFRLARDRRLFKGNLVGFGQFCRVRRHRHV